MGRDVLNRIIHGARTYLCGYFNLIVQRFVDALLAFPGIVFSLTFLTIFSSGLHIWIINLPAVWQSTPLMIVITLTIVFIPSRSRIVRGATFAIIHVLAVDAAGATSCTTGQRPPVHGDRVLAGHLPPGSAISLAVLAFNPFGDALRDVLDPRLRRSSGSGLRS